MIVMLVSIDEFEVRFPRPLNPHERSRAEVLLGDAQAEITAAFAQVGRSLDGELSRHPDWFPAVAARVVREMVAAAILVGDQAGRRQAQTAAGMISESTTWADVGSVSWGEVVLTDVHRRDLGLDAAVARGRFPPPPRWPERRG